MSSVKLAVPKERLNHAVVSLAEFRAWTAVLLKDADFKGAETVEWDPRRQCCLITYWPPVGERMGTGVDYATIVDAIDRVIAVRSRRRVLETLDVMEPKSGWWREVKKTFSPLFDRAMDQEVGDGWVDLTLALADWLWQIDADALRIDAFADRDGELRIDAKGYDDVSYGILESFEWLSGHVCEICGGPGSNYGRGAILPAVTRCFKHKPETDE